MQGQKTKERDLEAPIPVVFSETQFRRVVSSNLFLCLS